MSEVGPVIDVPALFGYNLMYDQPIVQMKNTGNQRMSVVSFAFVFWTMNIRLVFKFCPDWFISGLELH